VREEGQRKASPIAVVRGSNREPEDRKRFYCWAAVGWNFKSDICFYDSGAENAEMTQGEYIEEILEPIMKPYRIKAGISFF
jgi:hypothetical protein